MICIISETGTLHQPGVRYGCSHPVRGSITICDRNCPVIFVMAFVLMALVKSPLGVEVNGARRWLKLGIQFQPSEIARLR